jgi:hypothetical protein
MTLVNTRGSPTGSRLLHQRHMSTLKKLNFSTPFQTVTTRWIPGITDSFITPWKKAKTATRDICTMRAVLTGGLLPTSQACCCVQVSADWYLGQWSGYWWSWTKHRPAYPLPSDQRVDSWVARIADKSTQPYPSSGCLPNTIHLVDTYPTLSI